MSQPFVGLLVGEIGRLVGYELLSCKSLSNFLFFRSTLDIADSFTIHVELDFAIMEYVQNSRETKCTTFKGGHIPKIQATQNPELMLQDT